MVIIGYFNLGGGEIIVILAIILMLFGANNLPRIAKWLWDCTDEEAANAGRSVGGIYGKSAAEALRPDNTVAELYKPAAFDDDTEQRKDRKRILKLMAGLWLRVLRRFGSK